MGKQELDNLVKIAKLKEETPSRKEYDGMVTGARTSLKDSEAQGLSSDSSFTLAYGAAHSLALAALRLQGYRSDDRITVFQALVHTVGTDKNDVQIFVRAHNERNLAAYEGRVGIDKKLLESLILVTKRLEEAVGKLAPPAA